MSGQQTNAPKATASDAIELDVYRRSQANIRRLKEKLPEDLVVNLAREVILRVASRETQANPSTRVTTDQELEALCHALISSDDQAGAQIVSGLRAEGMPAEDIYLSTLASAARMLGKWWEEDQVSFSQVTVGSGRIFAIMRGMRHLFEPTYAAQDKTAIFASVPGEDHTLGVRMAADLFRKDGWEIGLKIGLDHDQLISEIEQAPTGIIGLSISGRHSLEALSRLVVALHICCPNALLVVSGQDIDEVRPVLDLMGLDGIAATLEEAQEQIEALWTTHMAI